jgi:hypothetical protein
MAKQTTRWYESTVRKWRWDKEDCEYVCQCSRPRSEHTVIRYTLGMQCTTWYSCPDGGVSKHID